jgi:hypothetical protein
MRHCALVLTCLGLLCLGGAANSSEPIDNCTPAYFELKELIAIQIGASELNFRLLAIGCQEKLAAAWPPDQASLEREFRLELQGSHPVQTAMMIRDGSPDLRARLVARLNSLIEAPAVTDIFLFDIKVAEYFSDLMRTHPLTIDYPGIPAVVAASSAAVTRHEGYLRSDKPLWRVPFVQAVGMQESLFRT